MRNFIWALVCLGVITAALIVRAQGQSIEQKVPSQTQVSKASAEP